MIKNKKLKVFKTANSVFTIAAMFVYIVMPLTLAPQITNAAPPVPAPNPPLGQSCGLDIALVLDNSASISSSELSTMRTAFHGFVNTLVPATPTEFSVTKFNTTGNVVQTFSIDAATINSGIDAVTTSSGYTNWQDGLADAYGTFDPRPEVSHPNLIVFASDGEPNRYNDPAQGSGPGFNQTAFEEAVTEANLIKNAGTRIITLGIGLATDGAAHLQAISSADAYYNVASFGALASTLQQLAITLCGGTITVTKYVDQNPAQGWDFDVGGVPQTTDQNGQTQAVELTNGTYNVIETPQAGYTLDSASCVVTNNGNAPVGTPDLQNYQVTGIQVNTDNIISCVFYNTSQCTPTTEICDGVDNDCDGQIDENLTRPTTCGLGICSGNTGYETCTAGQWGGDTCDPYYGATDEICDVGQLDEDCDGTSNEDCECINGATQSCGQTDVGECAYGIQTCSEGQWGSCVGAINPTEEICDGLDNDCDGQVDEGCPYCGDQQCNGDETCSTCPLDCGECQCIPGPVSLYNAGFETPVISGDNWQIYPSGTPGLGWTVGWAGSYSGAPETANLELQKIYTPAEGNQYAELDTDWDGPGGGTNGEQASVVIYQNVPVVPYATYQLSFKLSARPGYDATQNNVRAQFGAIDQTNSLDGTTNEDTVWYSFSYPMTNDNSTMKSLTFTDLGTPDSFGMFIDDVRLARTCPEEPTTGSLTICKYNDQGTIGQYEEGTDTPLAWGMTVTYPNEDFLYTGTNGETGCVTIPGLPYGTYSVTEDSQVNWVRSYPAESDTQIAVIDQGTPNPEIFFLNYYQEPTPSPTPTPTPEPYCGDQVCNGNETCATCPSDCGVCVAIGGGGGGGAGGSSETLLIYDEAASGVGDTSATITWKTKISLTDFPYPASSQVIYGAADEDHTLNLSDNMGVPPLYGYAHTTPEYDTAPKVVDHSVTITGLTPGTTYFFRCVSRGSFAVSNELSLTTTGVAGVTTAEATPIPGAGTPSETPTPAPEEEKPLEGIGVPEATPTISPEVAGAAAVGAFGWGNLCWFLLALLIILLILYLLSALDRRKSETGEKKRWWILPLVTLILIIIYCIFCPCSNCNGIFCCKICWILIAVWVIITLIPLLFRKKQQ
jgi:hypothetical protein